MGRQFTPLSLFVYHRNWRGLFSIYWTRPLSATARVARSVSWIIENIHEPGLNPLGDTMIGPKGCSQRPVTVIRISISKSG
jgi:hypothetical protein